MDALMRRGDITLALTIPPDFTQRVLKRDKPQILAELETRRFPAGTIVVLDLPD